MPQLVRYIASGISALLTLSVALPIQSATRIVSITFARPAKTTHPVNSSPDTIDRGHALDTPLSETRPVSPGPADLAPEFLSTLGFGGANWGATVHEVAGTDPTEIRFVRQLTDAKPLAYFAERCRNSPKSGRYSCLKDGGAPVHRPTRPTEQHALVLAEYAKPGVGYYLVDTQAVLGESAFDFCLVYFGEAAPVPTALGPLSAVLMQTQLCGYRLMFADTAIDPVTGEEIADNASRVLRALTLSLGPPVDSKGSADDRLEYYTWCRTDLQTDCTVDIVYVRDRQSGHGFVAVQTSAVYAAVHNMLETLPHDGMTLMDYFFLLTCRDVRFPFSNLTTLIDDSLQPRQTIPDSVHKKLDLNPTSSTPPVLSHGPALFPTSALPVNRP
jgi:hypothetical protein